jgi:CRP-like cAMP-binding protein
MSEILKHQINQIVTIDDKEFEDILMFFKPKHFRKKQFVIQENQLVDNVYFVEEGILKNIFIDEIGKEHILQFACANWWISDFAAFFKKEKSTLAVECISDSKLLSITHSDLELVCNKHPKVEHFFRVKSNFGYVALQQRILSLMTQSAKVRYENFCNQYPEIQQKIPKQQIANYLGVSRETLSRLQK